MRSLPTEQQQKRITTIILSDLRPLVRAWDRCSEDEPGTWGPGETPRRKSRRRPHRNICPSVINVAGEVRHTEFLPSSRLPLTVINVHAILLSSFAIGPFPVSGLRERLRWPNKRFEASLLSSEERETINQLDEYALIFSELKSPFPSFLCSLSFFLVPGPERSPAVFLRWRDRDCLIS